MCTCVCVCAWSLSHLRLFVTLQTVAHQDPLSIPGKNIVVGSHSLLQGVFPTQGSNPGLLHCRCILYHLSHQGSPVRVFSSTQFQHMWLPSQSRYTAPFCGMVKQMGVHLYHRILLSIHTQGTMPLFKKAYLKWLALYSSIYVTFLKWQNYRNEKQISGCHGLEKGGKVEVALKG